jgi:hypothetical protein
MHDYDRRVVPLFEPGLEQSETRQVTPFVIGNQQYWMISFHTSTVATALGCGAMRRHAGEAGTTS